MRGYQWLDDTRLATATTTTTTTTTTPLLVYDYMITTITTY